MDTYKLDQIVWVNRNPSPRGEPILSLGKIIYISEGEDPIYQVQFLDKSGGVICKGNSISAEPPKHDHE